MVDELINDASVGGLLPVEFGFAHVRDNHHNVWSGRNLACGGHAPQKLGVWDTVKLAFFTDSAFFGAEPTLDNHKIQYDGLHSPLEETCVQLAANAPRHRAKNVRSH